MNRTRIILDCPVSPWLVGAFALAIAVTVMVFVRRDVARLHAGRRRLLTFLGLLGVLLVAGVLLNPRFIRTWEDPRKPGLALVVDASRSMLLKDGYRETSATWLRQRMPDAPASGDLELARDQVLKAVLAQGEESWLAELGRAFELSGWQFSVDVTGLNVKGLPDGAGVANDGYVTDLGAALEEAAKASGGVRPRGIVLLSDGAWNKGRDPAEVARVLGRLNVPVYAVGLGDPNPPRDVAVTELKGPAKALIGDALFLSAQVAATGMGPSRISVELLDGDKVIAERTAVTLPSGRPVTVNFSYVPLEAGRHTFMARTAPLADERDETNNSAAATIAVTDRRIRVLLIESEPCWEFRFLRSVFERDPSIDLTVTLLRPGIGPIKGPGYLNELPTDKKGLAEFDLVFLGDVPTRVMPGAFLKELADMVRYRGGALVIMAGRRNHYRGLVGTPVGEVLPVRLESALGGAGGVDYRAELTQEGKTHLLTRLAADPDESEMTWSESVSDLRWAAGVGGIAPGASVLLVHPYRLAGTGKLPLFVAHRVGSGKVMFCGIQGTWRWRKSVGDKYHYRVWAQAVRWLTKKHFSEGDTRARLSLDRTECKVGEKTGVEAYCLDADGFPLSGADVSVRITGPDGEGRIVALRPAEGGWGIYRATFVPEREGKYTLNPIVSEYGKHPLSSSATLTATRPDLERNFLAQDIRSLQAVAEAAGGRYFRLHEVDELPAVLAPRAERRVLTAEISPCRNWIYYTIMTAVLSLGWLLRKWSGLA